jgi:hypothetical protein
VGVEWEGHDGCEVVMVRCKDRADADESHETTEGTENQEQRVAAEPRHEARTTSSQSRSRNVHAPSDIRAAASQGHADGTLMHAECLQWARAALQGDTEHNERATETTSDE